MGPGHSGRLPHDAEAVTVRCTLAAAQASHATADETIDREARHRLATLRGPPRATPPPPSCRRRSWARAGRMSPSVTRSSGSSPPPRPSTRVPSASSWPRPTARVLAPKPAGLSFEQAAAIPLAGRDGARCRRRGRARPGRHGADRRRDRRGRTRSRSSSRPSAARRSSPRRRPARRRRTSAPSAPRRPSTTPWSTSPRPSGSVTPTAWTP